MSLHPHQHRALVAELRRPEWCGLTADDAVFAAFQHESHEPAPSCLKRLAGTRFLTAAKLAALPEKRRPAEFVEISDAEAAAFPTGLPGFPNKLRREWFDAAWKEVSGG